MHRLLLAMLVALALVAGIHRSADVSLSAAAPAMTAVTVEDMPSCNHLLTVMEITHAAAIMCATAYPAQAEACWMEALTINNAIHEIIQTGQCQWIIQ